MQEDNLKGNYAGFVSRLIAFGVDVAIVTFILIVLTWLVNTVLVLFSLGELAAMETILKILVSSAFALLFSASYFIFFWTLASMTPGKLLMGLRIVTAGGHPLTFGRAVRRMLGYIISIAVIFLGFVWILVDNRRQGWQDKIAGTFVVYAWDARTGGALTERGRQWQEETSQEKQEA
jgi:uncharacterized RDD family membrane protein YckC